MWTNRKRLGAAALGSVAAILLTTPAVSCQFSAGGAIPTGFGGVSGAGYARAAALTSTAGSSIYSISPGFDPNLSFGGYYGYPFVYSPFGDFLRGSAALTAAQGQFLVNVQQASQVYEQVRSARLDNRRRLWDEWQYERMHTPSLQDEREMLKAVQIRRALTDPPSTEVLSAKSLNEILDKLRRDEGKFSQGPNLTISEDVLKQINLTPRGFGGNLGLIRRVKDGAALQWPLALKAARFEDERRRLDKLLGDAVKQASFGPVDAGSLQAIGEDLNKLQDKLAQNQTANDLAPDQFMDAKRFLNQLRQAQRALENPNVATFLTQKFAAKELSVGDLIKFMASNGLEFAPSVSGDESAYLALHYYLTNYANRLDRLSKE